MLNLVIAQYELDYEWYLRRIGIPKNTKDYRRVRNPEGLRAYSPGRNANKVITVIVPRGVKLDIEIEEAIFLAQVREYSLKYEN